MGHVSAKMDTLGNSANYVSLNCGSYNVQLTDIPIKNHMKNLVYYIVLIFLSLGPLLSKENYPNLTYPLLLFPEESFKGTPVKVPPDTYHEFAKNEENQKKFIFLSARILFTRTVTFSRNKESDQVYGVSPGSDISNLQSFFGSNLDYGTPLWFNYAPTIDSVFYIKVAGNSQCTNCSEEGGSCYTGTCVCLPGYNGTFCDQKL